MHPEEYPYHSYPLPMVLPQAQSLQRTQKHEEDGLDRWGRMKLIYLREFSQLHQQCGQLEGFGEGERVEVERVEVEMERVEGGVESIGSYHQCPSSSPPHEGKEAGEAVVVLGIQEVKCE